jgi:hypothetical protein
MIDLVYVDIHKKITQLVESNLSRNSVDFWRKRILGDAGNQSFYTDPGLSFCFGYIDYLSSFIEKSFVIGWPTEDGKRVGQFGERAQEAALLISAMVNRGKGAYHESNAYSEIKLSVFAHLEEGTIEEAIRTVYDAVSRGKMTVPRTLLRRLQSFSQD